MFEMRAIEFEILTPLKSLKVNRELTFKVKIWSGLMEGQPLSLISM